MASRISTINVIPSTDNTWAVTPASEENDPIFFADKADAVTVAKVTAILRNSKVVVYNSQREIESITKAAAMFNQQLLDALNPQLSERMTDIFEELDYRIHVYPTKDHWQVSTLQKVHDTQFNTQDEAVNYAYQQALRQGYILYIYDDDGHISATIDPEDNLELSDATKQILQAVRDGTAEFIPIDELITELGLENDIQPDR